MSKQRRLTIGTAIAMCAALGVSALPAAASSPEPGPGVATRTSSEQAGRVPAAARRAALEFLRRSGCPLKLINVVVGGPVTRVNHKRVVARIVNKTLITTGGAGACTGVERPSGLAAGGQRATTATRYRSAVRSRTTPGDLLVTFNWRDATGSTRQTLGVIRPGRQPKLKFEPLMATFSQPPPAQTPRQVNRSTRAPGRAGARTLGEQRWAPWGETGRCLATSLLGNCITRKFVSMLIFTDDQGNIVSSAETVVAAGSLLFDAERRIRVETIDRNGVACRQLTIEVHSASIFGKVTKSAGTGGFDVDLSATGHGADIDVEVYTLCANGDKELVE